MNAPYNPGPEWRKRYMFRPAFEAISNSSTQFIPDPIMNGKLQFVPMSIPQEYKPVPYTIVKKL